ncbi:hypothetical protein HID58_016013, partial [Brassica napus]
RMKQEMTCLPASDVAWSEGVLSILLTELLENSREKVGESGCWFRQERGRFMRDSFPTGY